MPSSEFIEDLFIEFYNFVCENKIVVQGQDFSPIASFAKKIQDEQQFTKSQADFIIKLLKKYKHSSMVVGFDYEIRLEHIKWRNNFRILDLSKKLYVELRDNQLEICVKFPYQLKKQFETEINPGNSLHVTSFWDPDDKVTRLKFYSYNLIRLYEFAVAHNFEIDDSFLNTLADVEEIWQNSDEALPCCEITPDGVILKNASQETIAWWEQHITRELTKDLLLAKSMGYRLTQKPKNLVEEIAHSSHTHFWIKHNQDFFNLISQLSGKICVVLDRTVETLPWLQKFVADADLNQISRDDIKVCFRDNKDSNRGLNEWIKQAGVGGKVDSGRILIFESKPAKWLFESYNDVTLLVTNNIYPLTNILTRDWFHCHSCVIYLGNIEPTYTKGQTIVEL